MNKRNEIKGQTCPSLFLGEEYDIYVGLQAYLRYNTYKDDK